MWTWKRPPKTPKTKAETIAALRGHLEAMGCDCSALGDTDIEAGCLRLAGAVRAFGLTPAEFAERLRPLNPPPRGDGDE